jgi:hypothetical protein
MHSGRLAIVCAIACFPLHHRRAGYARQRRRSDRRNRACLARWEAFVGGTGAALQAAPGTFGQIRGAFRMADGRVVVADGATLQLRVFDTAGRFLSSSAGKGSAPGQLLSMNFVRRLRGDTIAVVSGVSTLAMYAGSGEFVRSVALPQGADNRPTTLLISVLANGTRVAIPIPQPAAHPTGSRWVDSIPVRLVNDGGQVIGDVGMLPYIELEQQGASPSPPWLSPIAVFAGSTDRFFAGFGDRYVIRVYSATGTLQSIIRRA